MLGAMSVRRLLPCLAIAIQVGTVFCLGQVLPDPGNGQTTVPKKQAEANGRPPSSSDTNPTKAVAGPRRSRAHPDTTTTDCGPTPSPPLEERAGERRPIIHTGPDTLVVRETNPP